MIGSELEQHLFQQIKHVSLSEALKSLNELSDAGLVNEMYITHIDATFEALTFSPYVNWENWTEEDILHYTKDEKNPYSFTD